MFLKEVEQEAVWSGFPPPNEPITGSRVLVWCRVSERKRNDAASVTSHLEKFYMKMVRQRFRHKDISRRRRGMKMWRRRHWHEDIRTNSDMKLQRTDGRSIDKVFSKSLGVERWTDTLCNTNGRSAHSAVVQCERWFSSETSGKTWFNNPF